jgi:hypothetical protein
METLINYLYLIIKDLIKINFMFLKLINILRINKIVENYKLKNKQIFNKKYTDSNSQILVEFNAFHSDHIFLSYISNYFSNKYKSKIISFYNFSLLISDLNYSFFKKIRWYISKKLNYKNFGIYKSFGTEHFIRPNLSLNQNIRAKKIFVKEIKKINKNSDIYGLKFNKIPFGDLFYDTYLKKFYQPTVNINSSKFKNLYHDFIRLIIFWDDYLNENNVRAIVGVHGQYSYAIIHRLAANRGIPVILHAEGKIYKLKKKYLYQHNEFLFYKKKFSLFSKKNKIKARKEGIKVLKDRISGSSGIKSGHSYISKSSFKKKYKYKKKFLLDNKKPNVLIATQDFFDSINIYGRFIFNDFYEWLYFLGKISAKTDYNWYIKDHPNYSGKYKKYQPFTSKITNEICSRFPNIKKIPSDTPHNQLIKEGVDVVLTVFGSVQFEYPIFNIPVITASNNVPTQNYRFSIKSKNKKDYLNKILNIKKIKSKFDINEIYEFYYMNFIYHNQEIVYPIYNKFNLKKKNWDLYWNDEFYKFWYENFNMKQHNNVLDTIDNFVKSQDITININHNAKKNN